MDGANFIVESQVIDHLRLTAAAENGIRFDLFLFGRAPRGRRLEQFPPERCAALEKEIGGRVVVRAFHSLPEGLITALWLTFRHTCPTCFSRRLVIHGRAKDGAFMGALLKCIGLGRPRLLYDQRGDVIAEALNRSSASAEGGGWLRTRLRVWSAWAVEWFGLRCANRVVYVTDALRRVIERRYPFTRGRSGGVFPCLGDPQKFYFDAQARHERRRQLGFTPEHRVLVYSGGLQFYQCVDEMIQLFREARRLDQRFAFLFITNARHHETIGSKLGAVAPADSWRVIQAPHDDIAGYLSAGDLGLLLRRRSPVNAVAAPTKFAEYVMCGLPVVLTEGIGDYSRMTHELGWGIVSEDLSDPVGLAVRCARWLDANGDEKIRLRIAETGRAHLSREARLPDYLALLREL